MYEKSKYRDVKILIEATLLTQLFTEAFGFDKTMEIFKLTGQTALAVIISAIMKGD